jgi:peptidoglycan-associated lipoprotein
VNLFLKAGTTLTEQYINTLANDEQKELAHQINRRTEFRVLKTDYELPKK